MGRSIHLVPLLSGAIGCGVLLGVDDYGQPAGKTGSGGASTTGGVTTGGVTTTGTSTTGGGGAPDTTTVGAGGIAMTTTSTGGGGGAPPLCPSLGPENLTLACDGKPLAIASNSKFVYWIDSNTKGIKRVPINGGTVETVIPKIDDICNLAVNEATLYVATKSAVQWTDIANPGMFGTANDAAIGCSIVADATAIYYLRTRSPGGELCKIGPNGFASIKTFAAAPSKLAVRAKILVHSNAVMHFLSTDGLSDTSLGAGVNPTLVAIDSLRAYWASAQAGIKVADAATASPLTAIPTTATPVAMTAAGSYVAWYEQGGSTLLIETGGAPPLAIGVKLDNVCGMAGDALHVFVGECSKGLILQMKLPPPK